MKIPKNPGKKLVFKRWSRTNCAVFNSLGKIIKIGVLSFTMSIVTRPSQVLYSQSSDSVRSVRNIDLEEVEIVSEGLPEVFSQVARTVTVISSSEISSSPAATIQDLLEYIAGIDIRQRNTHGVQADIQIRGGTFDQVLVLLNGINITDPQTGHFNLNLPIDLSSVERIEILHGAGARLYGANAYKGVINIITRSDQSGLRAGLEIGEYGMNHSNINIGISPGKHYHNLDVSRNFSDGYTENTDYKIHNLYYQGGLKLQKADITWQGGMSEKNFGANDFYSPLFQEQYEETDTKFGSLGLLLKGMVKLKMETYFRRHKDHFLLVRDNPSFYENFHRNDVYGYKVQTYFSTRLGYTYFGFEGRLEKINSNILGESSDRPVKVKGTENKFYLRDFNRFNNGFFVEQKYNHRNLYISGGGLINYNREFDRNWTIFPGLDVSYRLQKLDIKLFGSAGKSLRLPTFTDMYYEDPVNSGNPDLQPEKLLSIESGIEYNVQDFASRITIFMDQGNNVIDWVLYEGSSVYEADNIAEIISRGLEVDLSYQNSKALASCHFKRISVGYGRIDQEMSSGNQESRYADDFLKHKFTSSVNCVLADNFSLEYHLSYQSRNGAYSDYNEEGPKAFLNDYKPYWLSDIKITFSHKLFAVYLKAENLFDTEYNDVGNLVQPGRWIIGGVEVGLDELGINK